MRLKQVLAAGLTAAALGIGGAALAQEQAQTCARDDGGAIPGGAVPVVVDAYIQSYASARQGAGGVEIAVNEERAGVGLGRQTKEWLFLRQCVLAKGAGDAPQVDSFGMIQFSAIEHREADCAAYQGIVELYQGQRNALTVIDRDILGVQRGTYWDQSMGQARTVSSEACLGG